MGTQAGDRIVNATLSGTTPDTVDITRYDKVEVVNRSTSEWLWIDDTGAVETPTAAGPGMIPVGPLGYRVIDPPTSRFQVVGNGNPYSAIGLT